MSTSPAYQHIELYSSTKKLVQACYELTQTLPEEERQLSGQKLRTAVLSGYVFMMQGISHKSKKKHFKKAVLQLLVVEALLDLYKELHFITPEKETEISPLLSRCIYLLKNFKSDH